MHVRSSCIQPACPSHNFSSLLAAPPLAARAALHPTSAPTYLLKRENQNCSQTVAEKQEGPQAQVQNVCQVGGVRLVLCSVVEGGRAPAPAGAALRPRGLHPWAVRARVEGDRRQLHALVPAVQLADPVVHPALLQLAVA